MQQHFERVKEDAQRFVDEERQRNGGKLVPFSRLIQWLDDSGSTYHSDIFREFVSANIQGVEID